MKERIWHVYLLRCADGSLYCGVSTDVERRIRQHNGELTGGARCTRARRPVRLAACAACPDQGSALRLERKIKALPKREKLKFLREKGNMPCIRDAAPELPGGNDSAPPV